MFKNLLFDSHPLVIIPELAEKIGLNESIVLQQIHYWIEINRKANKNRVDDHYWTYNSIEGWTEQFPFWSYETIKRTFTRLETMGLVISANHNKTAFDHTKWYRIDYDKLRDAVKGEEEAEEREDWLTGMDKEDKLQERFDENNRHGQEKELKRSLRIMRKRRKCEA